MNISHWIERHAEFSANKTALISPQEMLSYADLQQRVQQTAQTLKQDLGIAYGDRVAYLGYNSADMLALLFACARLGALLVPLNWRLAPAEHAFILRDAGVKTLFAQKDFVESVEKILPDCSSLKAVACGFEHQYWPDLSALRAAASGSDKNSDATLDAPLLLVYTSGTTGKPKGAVLKQSALLWNALNSIHMHDLRSEDRILTALPMFHVGGLNIQTTPALYIGATVVLQERFDPGRFLALLQEHRPTLTVLVPATIQALLEHPAWPDADLSSLRVLTTGSSIVPEHLIHAVHARAVPVIQVYGSTETGPVAVYQRREDAEIVGTTGKAGLHCDLRIVDAQGHDVGPNQPGELLIRGGNVLHEYWNNPEATQSALQDGWYRSEDIGYLDAQGYVYIKERKKDLIISGGENIYPAELEAVLFGIPGVREAAVIGKPDERWGETPVAMIVLDAGVELNRERVLAAFQDRLARFKHPREVIFLDALPRNSIGKVQKYRLRQLLKSPLPSFAKGW